MFLTKDSLAEDDMKELLENALLALNDRFVGKLTDADSQDHVRLSLSLSADGVSRVTEAVCMVKIDGRYVPKKCRRNGTC